MNTTKTGTTKTTPIEKAIEKAAETAKKTEVKTEAVKKEVVKEADKAVKAVKPAVKKAAAKTAKKAAEVKTAVKSTVKAKAAKISIQFSGKDYSTEDFEKIAKDVWVYDCGKKASELKEVELYVKPEESKVYYVFNGDVSGFFEI